MAEIVPAILENNITAFEGKMTEVLKIPRLKRVQVDVSDGIFTPNKTVQLADLDILSPAFIWEAHLMVKNPENYLLDAKIAGFSVAVVHFEALQVERIKNVAEEIRSYKLIPGIAINPETEIEAVFQYLHLFDQVLIMSVTPGFQGGEFVEGVYQRVEKVKNRYKNAIIEVDGGIKLGNAKRLKDCGADLLVVGSGLQENIGETTIGQNFERFEIEIKNK